jgi:hypothetical protein
MKALIAVTLTLSINLALLVALIALSLYASDVRSWPSAHAEEAMLSSEAPASLSETQVVPLGPPRFSD